jgi:hypothetical protein
MGHKSDFECFRGGLEKALTYWKLGAYFVEIETIADEVAGVSGTSGWRLAREAAADYLGRLCLTCDENNVIIFIGMDH